MWSVTFDCASPAVLIRGAVERLTAAGAAVLAEHLERDALDHVVLADPEGNEFCVV